MRQWKLSPTDIALLDKWDAYTAAKVTMFQRTDTPEAPWTVIKSNDKKRARLEAMRSLLSGIRYDRKDPEVVGQPDPLIVGAPADLRELGNGKLSPTPLTKAHVTRWPLTAPWTPGAIRAPCGSRCDPAGPPSMALRTGRVDEVPGRGHHVFRVLADVADVRG